MSKITDGLPTKDRLNNDIYTSFRGMLKLQEIFDNPKSTGEEKVISSIILLYGGIDEDMPINQLFSEVFWFFSEGEDAKNESEEKKITQKQVYDFVEDEDYIIGGFQQAYNIDLADESMDMHWWRFMALFKSLPEDTEIINRIKIRGTDISKLKGEERTMWQKRKAAVALQKSNTNNAVRKKTLRERLLEDYNKLDNKQDQ